MSFGLKLTLFFLKIVMLLVPRGPYEEKIAVIPSIDAKIVSFDLQGWQYRRMVNRDSTFVHRYFYFPSRKDNAPIFLLFHGLNLDGRTFMNLAALADSFQLVAYDFPESTSRYQGNFSDFVDIADEFVDLLNIDSCYIAGVSFGGSIALNLAANHLKSKTKRLVLISTGMVGSTPAQKKERESMARWVSRQPDFKLYWFMDKLFRNAKRKNRKAGEDELNAIMQLKNPQFYRQVGTGMRTYDSSVDARLVDCPVLWLQGNRDNVFSEDDKKKIITYIPQVDFEVIDGGTHAMVFTLANEIAQRVQRFCSQPEQGRLR